MSMEYYVLSNEILETLSAWQRSIDSMGFDLKLDSALEPPVRYGHLPATWKDREAGFECGATDVEELRETYEEIDFGGPWTQAYAFRWSSLAGCMGALIAATAYAQATKGVIFDPQEGTVQAVEEAAREARENERNFPKYEALFNR